MADAPGALAPLSPRWALDPEGLARDFRAARPFPHAVLEGFLDPAFARSLVAEFPPYDLERFRNWRGDPGKAERNDVRSMGGAFLRLDGLISSPAFLSWLSAVTGIDSLEYDPSYTGGGTHENLETMGLPHHVDFNYLGSSSLRRRVNLLLFLNPVWDDAWGGTLELHPDPTSDAPEVRAGIRRVAPLLNTCVLFATSRASWHGVPAVRLPPGCGVASRRSFAAYFYRRDRLWEPRDPVHETKWIYARLPERIREGRVLDAEDLALLRRLLALRDIELEQHYRRVEVLLTKRRGYSLARAFFAVLRNLRGRLGRRFPALSRGTEVS